MAYKIVWLRVNGFAKGNATPPKAKRADAQKPNPHRLIVKLNSFGRHLSLLLAFFLRFSLGL